MTVLRAQELLGIKPHKTLTGRVINNDDPPEPPIYEQTRGTGLMGQVIDFVDKSPGRFTGIDVAQALGTYKNVTAYLHKLKRQGVVRVVKKIASQRDKHGRIALWEKI